MSDVSGVDVPQSDPVLEQNPTPITQDRVKKIFDSQGWRWFVDNEGDLGGMWNLHTFYFRFLSPEKDVFQVYGVLNREISIDRLEEVRAFLMDWHLRKFWPKCEYRITDDGQIRVQAENSVHWEYGATDAQILQQINCGIATTTDFFDKMIERLGL